MDLSILIVNWNAGKLLVECIRSVNKFTKGITFEFIVVDNASSDGSVQMLGAEFPEIKLIKNTQNVGFAKANNQAYLESKGKYICCLNPDTLLLNNALEVMYEYLLNNPECGIVGPKLLNPDGTIQYVCARRLPNLYTSFVWITGLNQRWPTTFEGECIENWDHKNSREVDCLAGACMVFRRDFSKDNKIFNESYFMFGEDVEICLWAKRCGYTIYYLSNAEVLHYGQASVKKHDTVKLHYFISLEIYFRNNHGMLKAILFRLLVILVMSSRLMLQKRKGKCGKILAWAIGLKVSLT